MSQSLFRIPLIRELTAVLVLKLAAIFLIRHLYFSEPVDPEAVQDVHGTTRLESHFGIQAVTKEKTDDQ